MLKNYGVSVSYYIPPDRIRFLLSDKNVDRFAWSNKKPNTLRLGYLHSVLCLGLRCFVFLAESQEFLQVLFFLDWPLAPVVDFSTMTDG